MRWVARAALLITAICAGVLLAFHLRLYDPADIERLFACDLPCWQGIIPGVTTADQALTILTHHAWVSLVYEEPSASENHALNRVIHWVWSDQYPYRPDPRLPEGGLLIIRNSRVEQLYVTTTIPLGTVWLALGTPDGGAVDYQIDQQRLRFDNTAIYQAAGLSATASTLTDCSVTAPDLWRAPVDLWLQPPGSFAFEHVDYAMYVSVMRTSYARVHGLLC